MISSYVRDDWYRASDEGATLVDASTGEAVARGSSAGVDLAGMVEHARAAGGTRLAAHVREHRDGLYEQSARTGATLDDARVDVDGGIGALFTYASKGRRELPNDVLSLDGPPEPLGRGGTFVGQTVYTSRPGVAVFVNAFNFPLWGMLEKLATAALRVG